MPDAPLAPRTAETLTAMARALYPHDSLDDGFYRRVVDIVAADADAAQQALLVDGVAALDAATGRAFVDLEEKEKLAAVQAVEGSPFFEAMRAATARHLYDDRALWARFGYEGASSHLGGYVERGFDDIDWISEADAEAGR
ncbi:MAG: hypothetical protein OXO52_02310 [Rhodospirillales bacterium]|nr:hypothetical protein [Rhodospirillales bacterium]MDE0378997.1 hypothetical protein [Rhodospirillales bacterium]